MKKKGLILTRCTFFFGSLFWLILLIATNLTFAQNVIQEKEKFEWEKIIPLITKKAEVEKYLGKPLSEDENVSAIYDTKFERITVWYNGAKEPDGLVCNWNISLDTVISYRISLTERMPISKFKYDLSKFERTPNDDGRLIYTNLQKGISFAVDKTKDGEEEIALIQYTPSQADIKSKCIQK